MKITFLSQAAAEVLAAWKCIPEADRNEELLADVAVQVVLDLVIKDEVNEH